MIRMVALWLFLGSVATGQAQVLKVVDQKTDEPLEVVTISSAKPYAFATTNAAGQADISAFWGAEKIEIRYVGYAVEERSFAELEASGYVIRLMPSGIFLDPVVISASRWSQRAREVPAHIATISARENTLLNPQTTADMLWASGEVFVQKSQQGGGSPMVRGFGTNRLLYAVDGVRMNTAIFRGGNIQNVISLDPFAIEHTEVLFGPGSVIYGSDAIGAVMSFTTLSPQFSDGEEAMISGKAATRYVSANNEKTLHFHVNTSWRKWALLTSISHNNYGDLKMGRHGPDDYLRNVFVRRENNMDKVITNDDPLVQRPTGYEQINLMQKVRYAPSDTWDVEYAFHYSATSDYSRYDRLQRFSNELPHNAEWFYGPQVWMMNQLSAAHHKSTSLYDQLSVRLAHQYFEESRNDRNFNNPTRFEHLEKVNAYSGNIDFVKNVMTRQKLYYGIEFVLDEVESSGEVNNIVTDDESVGASRYPQSTWSSYAAYASYQHRFSKKFLAQLGARFNQYALDADFSNNLPFYPLPFDQARIDNGALTGSLGFVFTPSDTWTISVNTSTGFRSPNVDDVGKIFDSTPGSVVVPNPELDAEYAYNGELGIAKIIANNVRIDVTGYYTQMDNAMVRRNYTLNGQDSILYDGALSQVQAIQNASHATVYGIQAGVEIKLGNGFSVLSKFNYQDGEEELDDGSTGPLRHVAPWFGVTRFIYASEKLDWQLYTMYNGEVSFNNIGGESLGSPYIFALDENGNPYSPAWLTLNFKASVPISGVFVVSAGVENLTDIRYRPYSSGLSAAGRNVILSLRASF